MRTLLKASRVWEMSRHLSRNCYDHHTGLLRIFIYVDVGRSVQVYKLTYRTSQTVRECVFSVIESIDQATYR